MVNGSLIGSWEVGIVFVNGYWVVVMNGGLGFFEGVVVMILMIVKIVG